MALYEKFLGIGMILCEARNFAPSCAQVLNDDFLTHNNLTAPIELRAANVVEKPLLSTMKRYHNLNAEERAVIEFRGTEPPGSGALTAQHASGIYACRRCDSPLYLSSQKFSAGCGWPSFNDELAGKITRVPDLDGRRTEIICTNCQAHLGHVFTGEKLTHENVRHCVNSIALAFLPAFTEMGLERAIVAGGCFWGIEFFMENIPGVTEVISGYSGGNVANPTYKEVCAGDTGHAEAVEIIFDPRRTNYTEIIKTFFEMHDPTQVNRQGPDVGSQYRSAIYYFTKEQRDVAVTLSNQLRHNLKIVTEILPASKFYCAEPEHMNYYKKRGPMPYCHRKTPREWR